VHKMEVHGRRVKMSIWDTAGQERFRTITASYYRGAQGVILVYDVSSRESFEALPRWLEELENYVPPEVVKVVVGNKLDKEYSRQVPTAEGAEFAAARAGCLFVEASAKTAVGVTDALARLSRASSTRPRCGATTSPRRRRRPGGPARRERERGPRAADRARRKGCRETSICRRRRRTRRRSVVELTRCEIK
ncbi:ras family-domain-containing protein, partial [Russula earlei]